ncbi:MAG: NAD-binding protein [Lautropia sp.]|nr:NAD-binding protein [Lautropia sp.]
MTDVLYMILRRLRVPLILLIVVYAISIFGLAMAPGIDPNGNPWQMGFFHATYVVSYTATTIGFGELPYPFSDVQRAWLTVSIYMSVVAWAYTLGSVFAMTTDQSFRRTVAHNIFRWQANRLSDPFFVICGAGRSSLALAQALDQMGHRLVVIELDGERAIRFGLKEFLIPPLILEADARIPSVLKDAGIHRDSCRGVIALTGSESANQTIAIGAKLLRDDITVIARATETAGINNLTAFGNVHTVNPFQVLATNIALDIAAPEVLRLEDWVTDAPGSPLPSRINLPKGAWVLVGYGRFGQAISAALDEKRVPWRAIDPDPHLAREARLLMADNSEDSLRAAGVVRASVLVAGTDNDSINLSITTIARRLNPNIFVIIRQNQSADRLLIDAARANLRFVQSQLIVRETLQTLKSPMLGDFITMIRQRGSTDASRVIEQILATVGNAAPRNWAFHCDPTQPGLFNAFFRNREGSALTIRQILSDPRHRSTHLGAVAVMLSRRGVNQLLPDPSTELRPGDKLLFLGLESARLLQRNFLEDPLAVDYVRTGIQHPRGWLFRRINVWRAAHKDRQG